VGVEYIGFALMSRSGGWIRNRLVTELDTMQKLAEGCNIQVPMEVVR
jgi:hypothetical protein